MKNFTFKLILSALLTGLSSLAFATNYYAAPNGTGTGINPSDTCSFATGLAKSLTGGDTLFLRGGQYNISTKTNFAKSGTSSTSLLVIMAYPGETPILDFRTQPYSSSNPGISINTGVQYLHIKGLTIRYAGDNGMINNGNYCIIENCTFYGNCDTGLQHKVGGGNLIKNCDSYANFDYQSGGLATPDFGGNADGFADKQFTNTDPNTYEGCRAWNNSDDGWDFFQRVGHTYLKNSVCYKNGPTTYNLTNHPRATTDAAWFANFTPTEIAAYTNYGNGNGFKIGGDYTSHDVTLTNCLSVGHKKTTGVRGFDQNNNAGSVTIYNCSAYDNSVNYGFYNTTATDGSGNTADLTIKNCVALTSTSANTYPSNLTTANNSWNTSGVTLSTPDFISMDTTVILTARQADGSLPNIVFMQIADGSDLIDAGVSVGLPFSGTAPDLGCFEKGTLDNFPGAVTTPTNATQTVVQGIAITPIVFTWSAGATGLTAAGLPDGIIPTIDNTAKTLTLSGAPTATGVFNYTISTEGGTGAPATVSGKIISGSATAKKIAYVTDLAATNDTKIYPALSENIDFSVTKINGTLSSIDYSGYDMIILNELVSSTAASVATVKAQIPNKPILMMKVFAYPKTTWNWGGTASDWKTTPSTTAITIPNAYLTHPMFTGISFSGIGNDEIEMVSQTGVNNKGVNSINPTIGTAWAITGNINTLGTIKGQSSNDICIMEIPTGTIVSGSNITNKFMQIGISGEAYQYATDNATKIISNSCYYLLGMPIPTSNTDAKKLEFSIAQTSNSIVVKSNEVISSIELLSIGGVKLAKANSNELSTSNLTPGVYILQINGAQIQAFEKVIIK